MNIRHDIQNYFNESHTCTDESVCLHLSVSAISCPVRTVNLTRHSHFFERQLTDFWRLSLSFVFESVNFQSQLFPTLLRHRSDTWREMYVMGAIGDRTFYICGEIHAWRKYITGRIRVGNNRRREIFRCTAGTLIRLEIRRIY
jgi:hypothetical protein